MNYRKGEKELRFDANGVLVTCPTRENDDWAQEDKFKHLGMSYLNRKNAQV